MKTPRAPIESVGIGGSAATASDEEHTSTRLVTTILSFIDPPFMRRLTTKLSDGAPAYQHAGAPALVCALGSAARGRALYVSRRSLQRLVRRRSVGHSRYLPLDPDG